ncbi:MAG: ABC transporter substrate-binding protein [Trueperaceae bacterium]|nr:ABC transporter substrate-binding protein [Trueperaceae bacterium]
MISTVLVAPDWFVNTNHTGFFVAERQGYYRDVSLRLQFLPYVDHPTAARRVLGGEAHVGLGPQETVIAYAEREVPLVAVAAVNAHNSSALAVLESSDIVRPRDLDGKRYASYGARFERHVVEQVIRNDGGDGDIDERVLPKPTVPDALLTDEADCTWVFPTWEGVEARLNGHPLRHFPIVDYGIPDMYTPVIFCRQDTADAQQPFLRDFLAATARGYEFAADYPEQAAQMLLESFPDGFENQRLVTESQAEASRFYRDPGTPWGVIDPDMWRDYGHYLYRLGFITDKKGRMVEREPDWDAMHRSDLLPDAP